MTLIFISLLAIALIAIALLVGIFTINHRYQQEKAEKAKLLSLNNSVRKLHKKHCELLKRLVDAEIVDAKCRQKLLAFSNNYFVFQTINEINFGRYVELLNSFSSAVEREIDKDSQNKEQLKSLLQEFASKVPVEPRDFSSEFYSHFAPDLVMTLAHSLTSKTGGANDEMEQDILDERFTNSVQQPTASHTGS